MAKSRIAGITVEIGGDVSGLDKALEKVNKKTRDTQEQLRAVERLLKLDPTNTELLAQRQRLLGQAVSETREKLDTLKTAEKQVQEQFKRGEVTQEQYEALQREIIYTANKLDSLEDAAEKSNASIAKIGATLDKVSSGAGKVANATKGISAAAGAGIGAIAASGLAAAAASDDLNTLAKQTGFATATLQKAQLASDLIDVSYETFSGSVAKMTARLRTNEDAFASLGIATRDANGELYGTEDIFWRSVDALSAMQNETERDIAAQELFGKSAADLAGIIDDGGAAFRAIGADAEKAGLIMSQETLDGLNAVNDQIDTLKYSAQGALAVGGAKALEALSPVIDDVVDAGLKLLEWIGNLDSGQIKLILTIGTVLALLSPVASGISGISAAISKLTPLISQLSSFVTANISKILPAAAIIAFVALIATKGDEIQALLQKLDDWLQGIFARDWTEVFGAGLGDVLNSFFANVKNVWDSIKLILDGVIDFIRGVFSGDWKRAWQGVREIFSGIMQSLKAVVTAPLNGIIGMLNAAIGGINGMIDGLNKLPFFDIGHIGQIPYLAKGGILSQGSAIVGEAGPELLTLDGSRAIVQPLTSNTTNHTHNNMGGITMTINGAPGQDVRQLADIVMREMQYALDRKVAARG